MTVSNTPSNVNPENLNFTDENNKTLTYNPLENCYFNNIKAKDKNLLLDTAIRNFGVIAHVDSGKTTLTERILFFTGKTKKVGEVHDGAATTDFDEQEQARGITIQSACITTNWKGCKVNLIDTPGHVDFIVEVIRALKSCDGVVLTVCGVAGIQAQTAVVWNAAHKANNQGIIFVNKLDRQGADFFRVEKQLCEKMKLNTCVVTIPVGIEDKFNGIIDVVEGKMLFWEDRENVNTPYKVCTIPEELMDYYKEHRENLCSTLAGLDDELADIFFETGDLPKEKIYTAIRKYSLSKDLTVITCGSAYKNIGVQRVLDLILLALHSPDSNPTLTISDNSNFESKPYELALKDTGPVICQVFKIVKDKFSGQMAFIRLYSGTLKTGMTLYNARTGKKLRVGQIMQINAKDRVMLKEEKAGNIVAILCTGVATSDTLCEKEVSHLSISSIEIPATVIRKVIIPKAKNDLDKIQKALSVLNTEDPSFTYSSDKEGNIVIGGVGELHLEINTYKMEKEYKANFTISPPIITYQETVHLPEVIEVSHTHKKQSGGAGQFAVVKFLVESIGVDKQLEFVNKIVSGRIPSEYIPSVKIGFLNAMKSGPLLNSEVMGLKITLIDGAYHSVDSSSLAFELCARNALSEFLRGSKCKSLLRLYEPIMTTTIELPEDYFGSVSGDINRRRGTIIETESGQMGLTIITANIPLGEMNDYISDLRSMTKGLADYSYTLKGYEEVPSTITTKIQSDRGFIV